LKNKENKENKVVLIIKNNNQGQILVEIVGEVEKS
jgi:hypothetical protein